MTEPKPAVLPLHHETIPFAMRIYLSNALQRYKVYLFLAKNLKKILLSNQQKVIFLSFLY